MVGLHLKGLFQLDDVKNVVGWWAEEYFLLSSLFAVALCDCCDVCILFYSLRLNRLADSLLTSGSSLLASVLLIALLHLHLTLSDR